MEKIFRRIGKDGLICGILGLFFEAFAGIAPKYIFIGGGILAVLRIAYLLLDERKQARFKKTRAIKLTEFRAPDDTTRRFAKAQGLNNANVVGQVIEVVAHHTLETMMPLNKLGVEPQKIQTKNPSPKNFDEILKKIPKGLQDKSGGGANNKKYGISSLPSFLTDNSKYQMEFFETDYNTWRSVRDEIEKNAELRFNLSSVRPEQNKLPQSMSLQYVVLFENDEILVMKNSDSKEGKDHFKGTWSFTGEEQLKTEDFCSSHVKEPIEHLFRRTFIEEVFGNRNSDDNVINQIWTNNCVPIMDSYRIWSFFLEENTGIIQMFGVFRLNIDADKLRVVHEELASACQGSPDPEGLFYVATKENIETLLKSGGCGVRGLYGAPELPVSASNLHPTSRYRLWRLYHALNRKPELLQTSL